MICLLLLGLDFICRGRTALRGILAIKVAGVGVGVLLLLQLATALLLWPPDDVEVAVHCTVARKAAEALLFFYVLMGARRRQAGLLGGWMGVVGVIRTVLVLIGTGG